MMHYRPPRRATLPYRLAHHAPFPGSVVIPDFVLRKLEARVVRAGENECWTFEPEKPWKPAGDPNYQPDPGRYAQIGWRDPETGLKQTIPASRLALIAEIGPISPELHACHLCASSRRCCNPRHLYAGTPSQNNFDRVLMQAIEAAQGTTEGVVLPPHPRSRMVCEALINGEDPAPIIERERRRLDPRAARGSIAKFAGGGLPPSPRPRPARGAAIAAV